MYFDWFLIAIQIGLALFSQLFSWKADEKVVWKQLGKYFGPPLQQKRSFPTSAKGLEKCSL